MWFLRESCAFTIAACVIQIRHCFPPSLPIDTMYLAVTISVSVSLLCLVKVVHKTRGDNFVNS